MAYLPFISDRNLQEAIRKVIGTIEKAKKDADLKLYKNVLDPFSALFDGMTQGIPYSQWVEAEKIRQVQKTMQNAIGEFHQDILGSVVGCENLGAGGGLDVCNREKKIIAEIKNKFNTTKGNHKTEIYDAITSKLQTKEFQGYTGYYVEIIPQNKKVYDEPFVPPDNKDKTKRSVNEKIRRIDGKNFYALVTGEDTALQDLFEILPYVIIEDVHYKFDVKQDKEYMDLFAKAYKI